MRTEDINEIKKELMAFAEKHKKYLWDTDAGALIEEAIEVIEADIARLEPIEAEEAYHDRKEVAGEARYDSEKESE
jgi:hypothetical protein